MLAHMLNAERSPKKGWHTRLAFHHEVGSRGTQKSEEEFVSYLYGRRPNLSFGVSELHVRFVS